MPTYQYACTECDHSFDQVQSFHDDSLTVCPQCSGRLRKLFNAVGVVFKGSGFYRNDSRSEAQSADADKSSEGKSGEGKSADSSSGEGKSSEGKSAESTSGEGKSSDKQAASKPSGTKPTEGAKTKPGDSGKPKPKAEAGAA